MSTTKEIANDLINQTLTSKINLADLQYRILTSEEWLIEKPKHSVFIFKSEDDIKVLQDLMMYVINGLNERLEKENKPQIGWDREKIRDMRGEHFCIYPFSVEVK